MRSPRGLICPLRAEDLAQPEILPDPINKAMTSQNPSLTKADLLNHAD